MKRDIQVISRKNGKKSEIASDPDHSPASNYCTIIKEGLFI